MEKELTKENLWKLRKEIVLNSIYLSDYQNSFGVDEEDLIYFFDGYLEDLIYFFDGYLEDLGYLMEENIENSFGVYEEDLIYFFDGYLEDLGYLMEENIENSFDEMFFDCLGEYDTEDNLYNYYLDTLVD